MRAIDSNVYRSQAIENTLQLIAGAGKDTKLFPTLRDALSFAATLGYQEGRKLPLDPNVGRDDIQSPVYNNNEAVDIIFSIGIADTGSVDILKPENEKDCIKIFEEYANGGMHLIQEWIEKYADMSIEDAIWRGLKSINFIPEKKDENSTNPTEPEF
jgi:dnd system-associated protein 4